MRYWTAPPHSSMRNLADRIAGLEADNSRLRAAIKDAVRELDSGSCDRSCTVCRTVTNLKAALEGGE
jgi:hypothetical protein